VGTQPFTATATGATYNGDQGEHRVAVSPTRTLALNLTGSAVFEEGRNGNGEVAMRAVSGNTGTGVIAPGFVTNQTALTGHTYRLQFTGAATYDVIDVTAATTVSSGNAYVAGAAINVAGMQTSINGTPANGDAFTLAPSTRQSLFATLASLVTALNTPASTPGASAQVSNGISAALQDLDQGLDNVLTLRATTGAQLRELDTLGSSLSARDIQYDASISKLADLDYNKALSDYARQQTALQAAQESFAKVTKLSLFDYLDR